MENYKSIYPTLRQAKTKWSKPSIVQKQGEGPSHGWLEMLKKDAKAKLAASILHSKIGTMHKQERIFHEEAGEDLIYHVTHTKHVPQIQKSGIMPMKTSNWVKAGNKERYGGGEVYAFTHKDDAHQWAGRMDWAHHQKLGSGNISIITARRPSDRKFEVDTNDPLSQAGKKGDWLKTHGSIEPHHIVSVEPYHPKKLGEDKVTVFHHNTQIQNMRTKETGIKRKKRMKDPRPTDFRRKDLMGFRESVESKANSEWIEKNQLDKPAKKVKTPQDIPVQSGGTPVVGEDKIGKQSPSVEQIAKKHGITVDQVNAQIRKGIEVEKEHTNNEGEAAEIARDHLGEFPDYYDRLGRMEKSAKKEMKKEGYDPEVEIIRNRIEAHKNLANKMKQQHGENSREATFHSAYAKHMQKQLKDQYGLDEAKKDGMKGFKMMKNDPPVPAPKKPLPVPAGYERVKDRWGFNVLRKIKEDAVVANCVGGGMSPTVGGEGNIKGFDPIQGKPVRRKRFAGKQVFVVDPTTYHKAYLGKRKYEHYEKYLEGCDIADEIREYGRKYWDEPIIIENEQTGAMVYLKYGSK